MNNFNDILRASCLFYQYLAHIGAKIVFGNLYYLENSKKFSAKIDPHPGDSTRNEEEYTNAALKGGTSTGYYNLRSLTPKSVAVPDRDMQYKSTKYCGLTIFHRDNNASNKKKNL